MTHLRERQATLEKEVERLHTELIKTRKDRDNYKASVKELQTLVARMESASISQRDSSSIETAFKPSAAAAASNRDSQDDSLSKSLARQKELEDLVIQNYLNT